MRMLVMDLRCVLCLIVFAHITESKIYVLRDYDDEPLFIDGEARDHDAEHNSLIEVLSKAVNIKPKRPHKQAVIHYGRHIYHLDSFGDLTKLRSELNPDYISYDYFDINDLIRSSDEPTYIPLNAIKNILDLSHGSLRLCKGRKCKQDHRKYSDLMKKFKRRDTRQVFLQDLYDKKKSPISLIKRFKIVDNGYKHEGSKKKRQKEFSYESEEKSKKKKNSKAKHRYKKKLTPESASQSDESKDSKSESLEIWKITKEAYTSESKSSEEGIESTEKPKKKSEKHHSESKSSEENSEIDFSNSIEDKGKKKRPKPSHLSSEEMRKKFNEEEDFFLQGNKVYSTNSLTGSLEDRRRRLPQFLPKRFHWEPSDIHELGYYWFNGPKGRYPAPKALSLK